MTEVLLLGGGHAHAFLLSTLIERPLADAHVTLVTPSERHTYSGMLPGMIAGHYAAEEIQIDVAALARRAGATLVMDRVVSLDPLGCRAGLESGATLGFERASLNLGSLPDFFSVPGAAEHALPVKPFERFLERWTALRRAGGAPAIAVVGAGAGGVEVAMSMAFALPRSRVVLYSDRAMFSGSLARTIAAALRRNRVEVRAATAVTAVEAGPVVVAGGSRERYDAVIWTAGAAPLPWLRASGLAVDERGFPLVDATLRSVSHPGIFAVGDTATLDGAPHPKSGVYAVRHGALLARNLPAVLGDGPLGRYTPQRRALALLACGDRRAIMSWGPFSAEGAWAWRWKDRLDRDWIARYRS